MSNDWSDAPIVLVHGLFGFDKLTIGGADYFRSIPAALRNAGHVVPKPPRLDLAGSIAKRAGQLKKYLEDPSNKEVFGKSVHIIAHSMGGLDARYMISELDMASRVHSLTTISAPHHGSPIADVVVAGGQPIVAEWLGLVRLDINGIGDLTTDACRRFNEQHGDPSIRCFSVAGRFEPPTFLNAPLGVLGPMQRFIARTEGDNDGLVSVQSANFGLDPLNWKSLGLWEANHFRVVNWGTNLGLTPSELSDDSIIRKYLALVDKIKGAESESDEEPETPQ